MLLSVLLTAVSALAAFGQDVTVPGPAGCGAAAQSGAFEVPCGVTNVTVELYGGGGGAGGGGGGSNGGFFDTRGGGGGGGGGYTTLTVDVTPGSIFTYSIGSGGCGGDGNGDGSSGDNGQNGGNTTINGTDANGNPVNLSANGGARGTGGSGTEGSPGSGGAGGTASGGGTNTTGTSGNNGNGGTGGTGGAGAGPSGGNGGAADGGNGTPYGGGGGGGENSDGGNGAPGGILITFNGGVNLPPGPTITTGAPTCTMDGTSTIDNYDPNETYTFDPTGPNVSAGGLISGMTTGTSYTVISGTISCPSQPSAPFSNAAATGQLDAPTISTTQSSCTSAGSSTVTNYNAALTYAFTPTGPSVGTGGAITGMTTGTSYTVIASEGINCVSPASNAFSNDPQLSGPTVSITGGLSHCPGETTTVTASGGTSYYWSSGEVTASATLTQGSYTVTVTDAQGCSTTEDVIITQSDVPVAAFQVVDACAGTANEFYDASFVTNGTIDNWDWDFGDGGTSTNQNPTHSYALPGTYDVTLTVGSGSCTDQITLQANSFESPTADFTTANVCEGEPAVFTDNSSPATIAQWAWDFDGQGNAITQNASFTFPAAGTYNVTLGVISSNFCTDTYSETVTVHPAPAPTFTATVVCEGNPTVFQNQTGGSLAGSAWDFGDGSGISTAASPTYIYSAAGTYPVTLGVTTANGCIGVTIQNVTVNPLPTVSASSTDILCAGQTNGTAIASASGGTAPYSFQWNDPFQSTSQSLDNLNQGSFTVTVTDGSGCVADTTVVVSQPLPINVQLIAMEDTCHLGNGAIQAIIIGGTAPYEYVWSSISDSSALFSENITPSGWNTMLAPGDYSVVVTDAGGCTASAETEVGLISPPVADFTTISKPKELIDPIILFDNESSNAVSYEWHFGDDHVSYEENPVYEYEEGGVYLVMLIAYNDPIYGCTDTTFRYIDVDPFVTFYVPNAFTPDDDGTNDTWGPLGENFEYESYNLKVFDRWGQLIWQTDNPTKFWDGTNMNSTEPVKQGMYVYQFVAKHFNTFEPKILKGTVTLYRHRTAQ